MEDRRTQIIQFFTRRYILFFIGTGFLLLLLLKMNIQVWHRLTMRHLLALTGPYLFSFALYWLAIQIFRISGLYGKLLVILLAGSWHYLSMDFWVDYTYSWLPAHGISFAGKLTDYHLMQFHNRIMVGNLLTIGLAAVVHLVYKYCSFRLSFQLLKIRLDTDRLAGRLSMHFVKEWIKIVQHNKLLHRNDTLELFRYINAVTANRKVKVSIAEEWKQLKVMASCFTDRLVLFKGEEVLLAVDWNRSIIAASMLSWFENALNYSPQGAQGQIIMEWTRLDGQLHFQMINYVSGKRSEGHTGVGNKLLQELFDAVLPGTYRIEYHKQNPIFSVQLTLL
ncbi:hypothetical protein [Sphingobacterium multivorum]|uniref:hypothetical protein n=1 Tax=Sphingobacterium multivorum TaxID=28454 RepID=UPI003DA31C29